MFWILLESPNKQSFTFIIRGLAKPIFESIVYNRSIVYKRQKILEVVAHVIIIDKCNQTAR